MSAKIQRVGDGTNEDGDADYRDEITSQILNCPGVLAAIQEQLNNDMVTALPAPVKRRIKALKRLQLEATNIEAKFFEEVHRLECKYHKVYAPLYEKRSDIVAGVYEPNEKECEWVCGAEDLAGEMQNKLQMEELIVKKDDEQAGLRGVPEFWLTIFKNVDMLSDLLHEPDEPILKHLTDIKVVFLEADPMGFLLQFYFSPNEYFANALLTKEYEMKCAPDADDPFSFEGTEIYKCRGCTIAWKEGKNVTVKTVKQRQKHKARDQLRTVLKTVQNDSFFNFFAPPAVPDDSVHLDENTKASLTRDFEIGHYLKERIVPRAVLYFTGEALDDEEYEEEDEDDDEEEEEDDDEEDSDSLEGK